MSAKPLKPTTHLIFWSIAALSFIVIVMLFKAVLLPFVLGIAVAYLLNPLVIKLGEIGIARKPAALMILGGFIVIILGFLAAVLPVLSREFAQLSHDLPEYAQKLWDMTAPLRNRVDRYTGGDNQQALAGLLQSNSGSAINVANIMVSKLAAGGQALIDLFSVIVFMPIVAYFMMVEWERARGWVYDLIPRHAHDDVMDLLKEINAKLSGFVRGQISVAIVLGLGYALALSIAGLKYGLLIGLGAGLISVIPMVGSTVGLIVSVAVAWFQSGDLIFVGIIAGIFIVGQLIEGNFLTPKLVGDSVGLHPLWVFFALLAGGSVLGILGMFLAVPVAAVIGVLVSYALHRYKQSRYYNDPQAGGEESADPPVETSAKKTATKKPSAKKKPKKRV